jgi:hypothetical protein
MTSLRKTGIRALAPNKAFAPEAPRAALERRLEVVARIRRPERAHLWVVPERIVQKRPGAIDPHEPSPDAA